MKKLGLIILLFIVNYCFSQERINAEKLKITDYQASTVLNKDIFVNWYFSKTTGEWSKKTIPDELFMAIKLHKFEIESKTYLFLERKYHYYHAAYVSEYTYEYFDEVSFDNSEYLYLSDIKQEDSIISVSLKLFRVFGNETLKNFIESATLDGFNERLKYAIIGGIGKQAIKFFQYKDVYRFIILNTAKNDLIKFNFEDNYIEIEADKISSMINLLQQ
jgi:hypothetical protein